MALASLSCWSQLLPGGFSLGVSCPPLTQGQEGGANLRRAVPEPLGCSDCRFKQMALMTLRLHVRCRKVDVEVAGARRY